MHTEDMTALSIVRLAYALDDPTDQHRCLNFRVGFDDHEAAFSALVAIGSYNNFDGPEVAKAIQSAQIGRYTRILIGREGSPVVYFGYMDEDARERLVSALQAAYADECDVVDNGYGVRAWWD